MVRALGAGGAGTSYDVSQAIRFAAGLSNDSGTVPLQAADIINLSLGGPDDSITLRKRLTGTTRLGRLYTFQVIPRLKCNRLSVTERLVSMR